MTTGHNQIIAKRLKTLLATHELSIAELARKSSVKPSFIYDILHGKSTNPSAVKLMQITEALNIPISALLMKEKTLSHANNNHKTDQQLVALPFLTLNSPEADEPDTDHPLSQMHWPMDWLRIHTGCEPNELIMAQSPCDSLSPELNPGDLLLLYKTKSIKPSAGIFLLRVNGLYTLRRATFSSTPHQMKIQACHKQDKLPSYPQDDITVIGRVMSAFKRY